tara:strand:- start:8 stop:1144 length:1137 start_codon:yes stop_codon:yes gene_type:complete
MDDSLIHLDKIKKVSGFKDYLVCTTLFRMKNSYKNFKEYTDGLLKELYFFDNSSINITFRIYFDESVENEREWENVIKEIKKREYTELVKYECKKLKDGKYHQGTIGTLMRFLPLFDNKKERDWGMFCPIDADGTDYFLRDFIDNLVFFTKREEEFLIKLPKCYYEKTFLIRIDIVKKYKLAILAGGFCSKITFNKKILSSFLTGMITKNKIFIEYSENNRVMDKNLQEHMEKDIFTYGIDEYFLSKYILQQLIDKKIKILIYNWFVIFTKYLYLTRIENDNFENLTPRRKKLWTQFCKNVLRNSYDNKKSLKKNFVKIERNTHCISNNYNKFLCYNVSREINKIFKNKQEKIYKISKDFEHCLQFKDYGTYKKFKYN